MKINDSIVQSVAQRTGSDCSCHQCGALFKRKAYMQIFCSDSCRKLSMYARQANPEVQKTCSVCSVVFTTRRVRQLCCSPECGKERVYKMRGSGDPEKRHGAETACKSCGKTYTREHHSRLYCHECSGTRRRRVVYPDKACSVCGNQFTPNRHDATACSDACRVERSLRHSLKLKVLERDALRAIFGDGEI